MDNSVIEVRVDEDCHKTFATIAHEVAHTWFHGNDFADWIDEGLADTIEHQIVAAYQEGQEIQYPPVTYCESYRNISELERGEPDRVSSGQPTGFSCNYRLGNGIFGALREYYGDDEFNRRIAQLARRGTNDIKREHTITDIRKVLGGDGRALDIINHWYDGQPEMRKYRHLNAVRWSYPPTIDDEYLHFAGTTGQPDSIHEIVLGKDPYCSQFDLYKDTSGQEWVTSIADPLPAGWSHAESSKVVTINHHISPDTGEFSVTAKIMDNALAGYRDLSLLVRSRVTTGEAGTCNESINYSQVPVVLGEIPRERKVAKYYHMDAVEWTFPPTIDGDYLHFAGQTDQPEMVQDFVLGKDPYCSQFALYRYTINQERVATISDPLLAGRRYSESSKVVTINHHISPDTGEFSVTAKIMDNALAGYRDLSLLVGSRVTTGEAGTCNESVNYSQVPVVLGEIPKERKVAKYYHTDAVEWTFPPTIDGDYLHFAGQTDQPEMVQDFVLGKDPYCSQFVLYRYIVNQEWVATVSDPLLAGWSHGETPRVVVVSHHISPDTGEFSVTAKINGNALAGIDELSLLVRNRVTTDADGACNTGDIYSQVPVVSDSIPSEIKTSRHYSLDAIQWVTPPTISGNTLRFVGQALPGAIRLTWQEGYCSQFRFYERDERGYHYIDSMRLLLPENRHWTGQITGEVTSQRISADGTFEALVKLSENALAEYRNPVLLVRTQPVVDSGTNKCSESDVLSAVDIR